MNEKLIKQIIPSVYPIWNDFERIYLTKRQATILLNKLELRKGKNFNKASEFILYLFKTAKTKQIGWRKFKYGECGDLGIKFWKWIGENALLVGTPKESVVFTKVA